ncbi:MAG TPA: DUF4153 domain-containing protein [Methylococcaceae bacterium]|nr:DUF4153 domain-containing protein [Methylococcaceae bacterium]
MALCAYAIQLRVAQYGWSVDRVWAGLVTVATGFFVVGYALVVVNREAEWMAGAAKVNIAGILATAALLLASATPLLDPARIATASQVERLMDGAVAVGRFDFHYLRAQAGRTGHGALENLAALEGEGRNAEIRAQAKSALAFAHESAGRQVVTAERIPHRLNVYPPSQTLEDGFILALEDEYREKSFQYGCLTEREDKCNVLVLDLNHDALPEYVMLASHSNGKVFSKVNGNWSVSGFLGMRKDANAPMRGWPDAAEVQQALDSRTARAVNAPWSDVEVGQWRFVVE